MRIVSTTSKQRIWAYNAPVFGVKKEIPAKAVMRNYLCQA